MSGCGTHLVLDLYDSVGIKRVDAPIRLLQAMALARKDAGAPCRMADYTGLTAAETVNKLSRKLAVAPPTELSSEAACFQCFGNALEAMGWERMVFGHHYYFSHSLTVTSVDGGELAWTLEDRDGVQNLLDHAISSLGIDFRQVSVLRNPVDIYLSQTERFKEDRRFDEAGVEKIIGEFFKKVAARTEPASFPVVRYEDLCRAEGDDLSRLLAGLHFSPADVERVNRSLIHGGNLDKWRLYPPNRVSALAGQLRAFMEPFGYEARARNHLLHALNRALHGLRKYQVEFRIINRLMAGDFSVDNAFSRHKRSLPARIWFRFRLLFPNARRNVELFYRTRKDTPAIPARPLSVVLRELLRGGAK